MSEIVKLTEETLDDKYIDSLLFYKLKNKSKQDFLAGTYLNIDNLNDLKHKLLNADFFKILELYRTKILLVKSSEIDIGYRDYLPFKDALEYTKLGLIPKDLEIRCIYSHGNIFTYIEEPIINLNNKVTFSNETYLFLEKNTLKIWDIKIGKPCNPNFLYYREDLDNRTFKLESLRYARKINRLNFSMGFFDDTIHF